MFLPTTETYNAFDKAAQINSFSTFTKHKGDVSTKSAFEYK